MSYQDAFIFIVVLSYILHCFLTLEMSIASTSGTRNMEGMNFKFLSSVTAQEEATSAHKGIETPMTFEPVQLRKSPLPLMFKRLQMISCR